jgi:hypothetical protein
VENLSLLKLINEIEAEREEVKYYKNKMKIKLMKIKEKVRLASWNLRDLSEILNLLLSFVLKTSRFLTILWLLLQKGRKSMTRL